MTFVVWLVVEDNPDSLVLYNIINRWEFYRADPEYFGLGELVERDEIDFEVFTL